MFCLIATALLVIPAPQAKAEFQTVEFASLDGLKITADLYVTDANKNTPFIVLCHQAGWSRAEYREIAPRLNKLGFNCLAIDQRSGGEIYKVANETSLRAKAAQRGTEFVDAEQDMVAALDHARQKYASGKLLLWGSSYSAGLALRIAGDRPKLLNGVLAFSPGEYFTKQGKPRDWVTAAARDIRCPTFVTSARAEHKYWGITYVTMTTPSKTMFLPKTKGNHGSRALWNRMADSKDYWNAVTPFLQQFTGRTSSAAARVVARRPASPRVYTRPGDQELRRRLTEIQYRVTQQDGTENAFQNEYWNNKRPGIYVDVVTGEPLFSAKDKFVSGTGWPSFTRPLVPANVSNRVDYKLREPRTEVRSKFGNSHLGHVFRDGPQPTGLRYCINSAALRFIPAERLEAEGYGEFVGR